MAFLAFFRLLIAAVAILHAEETSDSLPGMQLTNWYDSVMRLRVNRNKFGDQPSQTSGPYEYRVGPDYDLSSIVGDTFAIRTTEVYGQEPMSWDTQSVLSTEGMYSTEVLGYNGKDLPFKLAVDYEFPPYHPYYLVRYTITNPTDADLTGYLLDVVHLNHDGDSSPTTTFGKDDSGLLSSKVVMNAAGKLTFGHGLLSASTDAAFDQTALTFSTGASGTDTDPLSVFATGDGKLDNKGDSTEQDQTMGVSVPFTIAANQKASICFFRTYRATPEAYASAVKSAVAKTFDQHSAQCTREYSGFLARGKTVSAATKEQKCFYKKSLLFMKNAINPTTGAITGNFHPSLINRCSPREGAFIALSLEQAGYPHECYQFLKWLANVELTKANADHHDYFASAYDFWTSAPNTDLPSPQFDGAALFLMGAYRLYLTPETRAYLTDLEQRIIDMSELLQEHGYSDLFLPDYGVWGENAVSADGTEGTVAYHAWTQAFAYAGLVASSMLHRYHFHKRPEAEALRRRALSLHRAILSSFSITPPTLTFTDDPTPTTLYRYLFPQKGEDGKETAPVGVDGADAQTFAFFFLGLLGAPSSSSPSIKIPPIKSDTAVNQYNALLQRLIPDSGIASADDTVRCVGRYAHDQLFFTDKEAASDTPVWPSATAFSLFSEHALSLRRNTAARLDFLASAAHGLHAGHGGAPAGKAVDWSGNLLWSAAPDVAGHSALYVWSFLLTERKASMINPLTWASDNVNYTY